VSVDIDSAETIRLDDHEGVPSLIARRAADAGGSRCG
jgi:hypothetical protein